MPSAHAPAGAPGLWLQPKATAAALTVLPCLPWPTCPPPTPLLRYSRARWPALRLACRRVLGPLGQADFGDSITFGHGRISWLPATTWQRRAGPPPPAVALQPRLAAVGAALRAGRTLRQSPAMPALRARASAVLRRCGCRALRSLGMLVTQSHALRRCGCRANARARRAKAWRTLGERPKQAEGLRPGRQQQRLGPAKPQGYLDATAFGARPSWRWGSWRCCARAGAGQGGFATPCARLSRHNPRCSQ